MSMEFMVFFSDVTESQKLAIRPLIARAVAVATVGSRYEFISGDKWAFRYRIRSSSTYDVMGYQGYDYVNVTIESNDGIDSAIDLAISMALTEHAIEEHMGGAGANIEWWAKGDARGASIGTPEIMELLGMTEEKAINWWEVAFPVFQERFDLWT